MYSTTSSYEDNGEIPQRDDMKFLDMYSSIYAIRQDLERVKKPRGTRENPSRTCRDLYFGHAQFENGNN